MCIVSCSSVLHLIMLHYVTCGGCGILGSMRLFVEVVSWHSLVYTVFLPSYLMKLNAGGTTRSDDCFSGV